MTLNGAIKQLHDLRNSDAMPVYFKPAIAEVINVLLSDVRENVRGEWIDSKLQQIAMRAFIEKGENWKVCSVCGTGFMIGHQYEFEKLYHDTFHNFCPNCGADMRPISALSENVEIVSNLKRGES